MYEHDRMDGKVCVHWRDKKTGEESHGDAVGLELAEQYLRVNRGSFPGLDFVLRDAVTGAVVEPRLQAAQPQPRAASHLPSTGALTELEVESVSPSEGHSTELAAAAS